MSGFLYFVVTLGVAIMALALLRYRARREFRAQRLKEVSGSNPWDELTSELGARLFDSKDSDFVRHECSGPQRQWFRAESTALALHWLHIFRKEVNRCIREHLKAARSRPDLKASEELHLALEFLLFQATCAVLSIGTWVFGASHVARLAGYPLQLAEQLQKMTQELTPGPRPAAVELLDVDSRTHERREAR